MTLNREQIKNYLPHRDPFLFVDEACEVDGKKIEAKLFLDEKLPFFAGHFPQNPIMPGVLITEALAQTCGLALAIDSKSNPASTYEAGQIFYLASNNMKFIAPIIAGETLHMSVKLSRSFNGLHQFIVSASNQNKPIAEGTIVLASPKKSEIR